MKLFVVLLCVWLPVLVFCDDLTDKYMKDHFDQSRVPSVLSRSYYSSSSMYDYTGQCCTNSVQGCNWYRRRPYNMYQYWVWSRYRFRGCYWYPFQYYWVYCFCNQAQTCSQPTTSSTTLTTESTSPSTTSTTSTTTTAPLPFCPAAATTQPTQRLLGGTGITACDEFPGLVSIIGEGAIVCNGVITGPTTLSIPNNCALFANGASVMAQNGTVIASNISVTGTGSGGPLEVTLDAPVTNDSCPGIACVYSSTMANDILLDTCKVATAGYDSNTEATNPSFSYLDIPSLQPTSYCPLLLSSTSQAVLFDFNNTDITYNCFISPGGSTCQGDMGGPVVCSLTTGEQVVIGQVENAECTATTVVGFYNLEKKSVRVLPAGSGQVSLG